MAQYSFCSGGENFGGGGVIEFIVIFMDTVVSIL